MRTTLLVCLAVAVAAHTAAADTALQPLAQPAEPSHDDAPKSAGVATALAIGGTLIGPALVATALAEGDRYDSPLHAAFTPMMAIGGVSMVLGPSLGNWYAGKAGSTGLALRLGGAATSAIGVAMMANGFGLFGGGNDNEFGAGLMIGAAGLGMVATGAVLDIISAPSAAADHNRRHTSLALAPIVSHAAGAKQTGLAVVGSF